MNARTAPTAELPPMPRAFVQRDTYKVHVDLASRKGWRTSTQSQRADGIVNTPWLGFFFSAWRVIYQDHDGSHFMLVGGHTQKVLLEDAGVTE